MHNVNFSVLLDLFSFWNMDSFRFKKWYISFLILRLCRQCIFSFCPVGLYQDLPGRRVTWAQVHVTGMEYYDCHCFRLNCHRYHYDYDYRHQHHKGHRHHHHNSCYHLHIYLNHHLSFLLLIITNNEVIEHNTPYYHHHPQLHHHHLLLIIVSKMVIEHNFNQIIFCFIDFHFYLRDVIR